MRSSINIINLLRNAVAAVTGQVHRGESNQGGGMTIQAVITGSGALSASVDIYGAHNGDGNTARAELLGSLAPAGTDEGVDSIAISAHWSYIFADLTAISGTDAAVDVTLGV